MYLFLSLLFIFACGCCSPLQTVFNSRLDTHVKSPYVATFVSFVVGVIAIAVIMLVQYHSLYIVAPSDSVVPWWAWLGGACGAVGIAVNVVLFPKLGGVQTVLMPMLGQVLMGILIDTLGLFSAQVIPLSALRVIGILIAMIGSYIVVTQKSHAEKTTNIKQWPWLLLGVVGGVFMGTQPSLNSFLSIHYQSTTFASFISFITGTVLLLIFLFINGHYRYLGKVFTGRAPWWSYLGGLLGVVFVMSFAYFASRIGIILLNILNIFGMLVASVIVDKFGILGSKKIGIKPMQYVGLLLILLGIVCINL